MSRIDSKKRKIHLRTREKRKAKLAKLRERYSKAKMESDKEKVLEKVRKIAPWLSKEEFLAPLNEQEE